MADTLPVDNDGSTLSEEQLKHFDNGKGDEAEGFDPTEDGRG